ncbi:unnamed protein product [Ectocarpus sp. 8 AP-2014]
MHKSKRRLCIRKDVGVVACLRGDSTHSLLVLWGMMLSLRPSSIPIGQPLPILSSLRITLEITKVTRATLAAAMVCSRLATQYDRQALTKRLPRPPPSLSHW